MSHFYGEINSAGKKVTKRGFKTTGMTAHIRGWHVGVYVDIYHNEETGRDEVKVYRTSGSGQNHRILGNPVEEMVAHIVEGE